MFYFIVFLFMLIALLAEDEKRHLVFIVEMIVLTVILAIRFGQGPDYYSYSQLFAFAGNGIATKGIEIGFYFLMRLFQPNFQFFIAVISVFEMWMLYRFINTYSKHKTFSVLLAMPTLYLTYYFSAIRQGIIISVFIGYLLNCLLEEKWIQYYVVSLLCCTIHLSAAIFLLLPIIKFFDLKTMYIFIVLSIIASLLLSTDVVKQIVASIPIVGPRFAVFFKGSFSFLAIMHRYVLFSIIMFLYLQSDKSERCQNIMLKIYIVGIIVYTVFSFSPLIASRSSYFFKVLELVLIPNLFIDYKHKDVIALFFVCLAFVMLYKNIASYIYQGGYIIQSVIDYPYITIFNTNDLYPYVNPFYKKFNFLHNSWLHELVDSIFDFFQYVFQ